MIKHIIKFKNQNSCLKIKNYLECCLELLAVPFGVEFILCAKLNLVILEP